VVKVDGVIVAEAEVSAMIIDPKTMTPVNGPTE
jgi:hypothetical protein